MIRLILTAVIALSATAPAQADPGEKRGLRVAAQTWGTPECGVPTVETSTPEQYQRAHDSGYFDNVDPAAWADENRCVIVLNPRYKIRTAAKRCHVIVHEWGHLAGQDHSDNYRSVMYEDYSVVGEAQLITRRGKRWTVAGAFKACR